MKKSFAKKSLSILLSLLMLLSVFGVAASAYDAPDGYVAVPVYEEAAPDDLADGTIWFDGHMYADTDYETGDTLLPEAYYNEAEESLFVVLPDGEELVCTPDNENFPAFSALHKVNEFDTLAFDGYIKLGVGKDSAGEDGYYLAADVFEGELFYNPETKAIKYASSYFYAVDMVEGSEYYDDVAKWIVNVADPEFEAPEGFIPVPYTAAEALAAGEEGLYLYFDVLKMNGMDTATMTIEEYREVLPTFFTDVQGMSEEEAADAVAAMTDEEVIAAFEGAVAEASEQMKGYFGNIYYNPTTSAIILAVGNVTTTLLPSDEPDWSQGVVYEEIYAGFNTAVPVFTPVVAGDEGEADVLDPAAIVVYAQADVNLLGATMTVAANVEITPEEIAKAESLPEMAGLAISKLTSFDISFSKGDDTNLQPSAGADVTIRMPVPDGYDEEKIAVFHIDAEGAVQKVESVISNGFIFAKAAFGFSPYFIAEVEEATTEEPTTEPTTEPTEEPAKDSNPLVDFLMKLMRFVTELFQMITRWIAK